MNVELEINMNATYVGLTGLKRYNVLISQYNMMMKDLKDLTILHRRETNKNIKIEIARDINGIKDYLSKMVRELDNLQRVVDIYKQLNWDSICVMTNNTKEAKLFATLLKTV